MSDLSTEFMGLTLKSPLVASASPLCESAENISKLARLIRRSALSEGFLGKTRSFIPCTSDRRRNHWIEDAVDALGVGG